MPVPEAVRLDSVRRAGPTPHKGPGNRSGLVSRTCNAHPLPQPEGLGSTGGPEPQEIIPVTPCWSTGTRRSLEGAPGAQPDVIVPRGRRYCRRGRCRSGRQRGRLQIALRLRNLHRVGDIRIAIAAGLNRSPEPATEDRDRGGETTPGSGAPVPAAPAYAAEPPPTPSGVRVPSSWPPIPRVPSARERKDSPSLIEGVPPSGEGGAAPSAPCPSSGPAGFSGALTSGEKDGSPSSASVPSPRGREPLMTRRASPSPTSLGTGRASPPSPAVASLSPPEEARRTPTSTLTGIAPSRWAASAPPGRSSIFSARSTPRSR